MELVMELFSSGVLKVKSIVSLSPAWRGYWD